MFHCVWTLVQAFTSTDINTIICSPLDLITTLSASNHRADTYTFFQIKWFCGTKSSRRIGSRQEAVSRQVLISPPPTGLRIWLGRTWQLVFFFRIKMTFDIRRLFDFHQLSYYNLLFQTKVPDINKATLKFQSNCNSDLDIGGIGS